MSRCVVCGEEILVRYSAHPQHHSTCLGKAPLVTPPQPTPEPPKPIATDETSRETSSAAPVSGGGANAEFCRYCRKRIVLRYEEHPDIHSRCIRLEKEGPYKGDSKEDNSSQSSTASLGQGDPNVNIALLSSLFNTSQQQQQFQTYLGQQYLQQLFSQQNQFNAQYQSQYQQSQYQQPQYQKPQPQIPSPTEPENNLEWEVDRILRCNDYYEVMSITRTFTGDELKKSYRKYALLVHPDKNPSPKSEEAFKLLTTAYTCLSDPYTRYKYDHEGLQEQLQQELSKKSAKLAQASLMELYSIFNNLFQEINKSLWG